MAEDVSFALGTRAGYRFALTVLVASALVLGAVGCSEQGGTEATATTDADRVTTSTSATSTSTSAMSTSASSTSSPSTSAAEESADGGGVDQALCDLFQDDRVAEAFEYSGFSGGPVKVEIAKPEDEALAASVHGCAAQLSQSSADGSSSATIVLGRVPYTGDADAPFDLGPELAVTWVPIPGEPDLYRAMQFTQLPIGGAIVVGDHAYLLLRTAVEISGNGPITNSGNISEEEAEEMVEAMNAESEADIVVALLAVARARG